MSTVIGIFKSIVACLPFAALLLLVKKTNLKKANRGRQVAMPLIALVYTVVLTVLLVWLGGDPFHLEALFGWIVAKLPVLQPYAEAIGQTIQTYLIFFTNAAMVLAFQVVKGICLPILSRIWGGNQGLMEGTAGAFYEYDGEYQRWFLREHWRDGRKLFQAIWLASFLIAVGLLVLSRQFPEWRIFAAAPYPCLACLMLGECAFLLGGHTRTEYEEDILGEDSRSQRVVNLSKLRELLRQLFGDRLLIEGTELESAGKEGVTDLLEELALGEKPTDRIAAEYFEILREDGTRLDVDNILSARSLLQGESVLFCNPFYKDLTQYFLLPMSDRLMHRRKCLVIAGRKSTEPELRRWLEDALREHLKMSGLWRVGSVAEDDRDYEIGLLSFSQLYDLEMLSSRREFFRQVGFVLMLEPSLILATGQVGLSLVVNYCDEDGRSPTYCICDRNCDGLVDTLSHMIKQSITIVSATETPTCLHTEMCWHSDGAYLHQRILPDISRYLGVGTELAVAAVKDQVPRVVWRSEKKFPVVDMKWIAGQYYSSICQYADLPMNQESVYNAIGFEADLWGTPKEASACLIVEDEFCNLLEMVRLFLTRAEEEAFVNVISEDYLLRGYMQHNFRIFSADRKAIPTIVPDYARTERNAAIRLMMLLLMSEAVPEETVEKELRLAGVERQNPEEGSWDVLNRLIRRYTIETGSPVVPEERREVSGLTLEGTRKKYLRLRDKAAFRESVGDSFHTAYFITEDDKENSSFMDAKLYGHIYQALLPGQFFTYDGKYYEVRSVTPEKGVLVRRAADHIVGRRYYRQLREYHLSQRDGESERSRFINGLEVTNCSYEFTVETTGYLELDESNDLKRAKLVRIGEGDGRDGEREQYTRIYKNKNVLRIRLPGAGEEVRYTLCLLLSEIFRTVYAGEWPYLAAVTAQTEKTRDALRGMLYRLDSPYGLVEEDCIYIIEDSDLDMGLLESVNRNLSRLLGIVADFLDWHIEMSNTPDPPAPQPGEVELPPEEKHGFWWRIKNSFRKILNFFKRLLHIKPKPEKPEQPQEQEDPDSQVQAMAVSDAGEINRIDDEAPEPAAGDIGGEDEVCRRQAVENRYQRGCYLRYGYDHMDACIAVDATLAYLGGLGFADNELSRARKGESLDAGATESEQQCDFCGLPLSGVSYDVLGDGRVRCVTCSASAIRTVEEFRALYKRVLPTMESFYSIRLGMPVRVRTADARVIAKQAGSVYKPTSGFDARVAGFARMDKDGLSLYIENGCPRLAAMETIAHELTHIWQYTNWNRKEMEKRYGNGRNRDVVYEGMAMWASIQFLYLIGETEFARRKEEATLNRDDEYGEGFRLYCRKYPLSRTTALPPFTPFHTDPPL